MTSDASRAALYAGDGADAFHELATVEADGWGAPVRLVNSRQEGFTLTSQGRTFIAYPFTVTWPPDGPDQTFRGAQFVVNNVVDTSGGSEPLLIHAFRQLPKRARVRFEVVRAATPDVIERRTTRLRLTGLTYDALTISGNLEMPDFATRRAGYRFTPDRYRNLRPG